MTKEAVVDFLFDIYQKRGYITTNDIFDACDEEVLKNKPCKCI